MNEKEARLADFCRRHGYEGAWFRRRANIAWIADGADVHVDSASSTGVASVLWTPRRKVVYCDTIEDRRLREEEFGDGWTFEVSPWWEPRRAPRGRFATDVPDDPFADLRAPLTRGELRTIRELGRATGEILARELPRLRPGLSEHEVAARLLGAFRTLGIHLPVLLVAADDRIRRYRHPIPTARKLVRTVMVAVCPRLRGLTVAATRLVHFGRRLPADLRRRHEAVCAVDATFHAATRPGARWCDALAAGIRAYRDAGFPDEWTRHHQGGPVGYEGRDFRATPTETRRILERQAVGWNPSIAGTKSEDTILSSGELLTATPGWPVCGTRPDILRLGS
ncbi:MAG TPA: M24 family metallopeptidase [Planctomycetota bacterium]|nr:M24 family metallopeptidase [Planctomycetota bacterium]